MRLTVLGQDFEVRLDSYGKLTARMLDGSDVRADSRAELEQELRDRLRRGTVDYNVPVVLRRGGGYGVRGTFERVLLRRAHATQRGAFLITTAAGEADTVQSPDILCLGDHVTDAELAELVALERAASEAAQVAERRRCTIAQRGGAGTLTAARVLVDAQARDEATRDAATDGGA